MRGVSVVSSLNVERSTKTHKAFLNVDGARIDPASVGLVVSRLRACRGKVLDKPSRLLGQLVDASKAVDGVITQLAGHLSRLERGAH